jgi:hypothetical protein
MDLQEPIGELNFAVDVALAKLREGCRLVDHDFDACVDLKAVHLVTPTSSSSESSPFSPATRVLHMLSISSIKMTE